MSVRRTTAVAAGVGAALVFGLNYGFQATELTASEVGRVAKGLGFPSRDLSNEAGKETFEVTIEKEGFKVPIGISLSGSKKYVWLTVFLNDKPKLKDFDAVAAKALKANFDIMPSMFYVGQSDKLMMGHPIDNRGVDAEILRKALEKVAADVSKTAPVWSGTAP